jgi:hypothetical protein
VERADIDTAELAAAVFGDAKKLKFVPPPRRRFLALQSGEDILC